MFPPPCLRCIESFAKTFVVLEFRVAKFLFDIFFMKLVNYCFLSLELTRSTLVLSKGIEVFEVRPISCSL